MGLSALEYAKLPKPKMLTEKQKKKKRNKTSLTSSPKTDTYLCWNSALEGFRSWCFIGHVTLWSPIMFRHLHKKPRKPYNRHRSLRCVKPHPLVMVSELPSLEQASWILWQWAGDLRHRQGCTFNVARTVREVIAPELKTSNQLPVAVDSGFTWASTK